MEKTYSINGGSEDILEVLMARMKEKEMTVYKLSKLTRIPQSTLSRYFNKKIDMSLKSYLSICDALNLRIYMQPDENILDEFNSKI